MKDGDFLKTYIRKIIKGLKGKKDKKEYAAITIPIGIWEDFWKQNDFTSVQIEFNSADYSLKIRPF